MLLLLLLRITMIIRTNNNSINDNSNSNNNTNDSAGGRPEMVEGRRGRCGYPGQVFRSKQRDPNPTDNSLIRKDIST